MVYTFDDPGLIHVVHVFSILRPELPSSLLLISIKVELWLVQYLTESMNLEQLTKFVHLQEAQSLP
jgi:hypothetical protein